MKELNHETRQRIYLNIDAITLRLMLREGYRTKGRVSLEEAQVLSKVWTSGLIDFLNATFEKEDIAAIEIRDRGATSTRFEILLFKSNPNEVLSLTFYLESDFKVSYQPKITFLEITLHDSAEAAETFLKGADKEIYPNFRNLGVATVEVNHKLEKQLQKFKADQEKISRKYGCIYK